MLASCQQLSVRDHRDGQLCALQQRGQWFRLDVEKIVCYHALRERGTQNLSTYARRVQEIEASITKEIKRRHSSDGRRIIIVIKVDLSQCATLVVLLQNRGLWIGWKTGHERFFESLAHD